MIHTTSIRGKDVTPDLKDIDFISDVELDVVIQAILDDVGTDIPGLRESARVGRFKTEAQRRAWFTINGLGRC